MGRGFEAEASGVSRGRKVPVVRLVVKQCLTLT